MKKLFGLWLAIGLVLTQTAPASAHAQLVSANPKVSAVLYKAPTAVSLTFDDDLIDVANANLIQVFNPKNRRVDRAGTKVNRATITTALVTGLTVGKYKITYRVLSADGHPITASHYFYLKKK